MRPAAGDHELDQLVFVDLAEGHADALARFLVENDRESIVRTFTPFPMTAATAERIAREPRLDRYYGAFRGDQLVALSMLRGWDEGFTVPSLGVVVDHRFQGRGLGGRLVDFTLDQARLLGCSCVRLSVWTSNQVALHLYQARGFVECERSPVLVGGRAEERIVMIKDLGGPDEGGP